MSNLIDRRKELARTEEGAPLELPASAEFRGDVSVDTGRLFKGLLFGAPISALLWWGLIEMVRAFT